MNNLFSSVNFLSSLPALLPSLPPQAAINKWFFTLASFFPCSTLLPSPLPKTPAHQPAVRGGSSSVSRLSPLTTLQSYHPALTIHLPPSSLHHRERACLFVRECLLGRAVFSGLKPLMFPLQQALKTLLLAVWDLLHGKMSVWSRVKEKRSERERARGPPRARLTVYCGWCIWRQPLTAFQPFEPHIKGWQNSGHCVAIWSVEMSCRHQTWTITHLKFKTVCGKPVYPLLLNI